MLFISSPTVLYFEMMVKTCEIENHHGNESTRETLNPIKFVWIYVVVFRCSDDQAFVSLSLRGLTTELNDVE